MQDCSDENITLTSYSQVCQEVNKENGWTIKGADSKTPQSRYAYKGNQWITFDDISMIEAKVGST